jgi:hypothetical protein
MDAGENDYRGAGIDPLDMIDPEREGKISSIARDYLHYLIRCCRFDVADFGKPLSAKQFLGIILRSDADSGVLDKTNRGGLEVPLRRQCPRSGDEARRARR